ncbi:hypothetical protein [Paracoccus seriniphilus]|uniref:hypothetical protein n=1 Tax=Paracoccus seriniphilus TaxID=184748 RepID=UPI0015C5F05E|nr:hypothetical protein [Paracoccus seriniphilus]
MKLDRRYSARRGFRDTIKLRFSGLKDENLSKAAGSNKGLCELAVMSVYEG